MSGQTAGQAAYEARERYLYGKVSETFAWDRLDSRLRNAWQAAAEAGHEAIAAAQPQDGAAPEVAEYEAHDLRHRLDRAQATLRETAKDNIRLRDGIRALLADVAKSADATRPSRKSAIEDELAIELRKLLEAS